MTDPGADDLARWLAAEEAGHVDEADALFSALAAHSLPLLPEPAGLTARILAALPRARAWRWVLPAWNPGRTRWGRTTVAASVGAIGLALATLTVSGVVAFSSLSVEVLARVVGAAMASLAAAAGTGRAAVSVVVDLGRAAAVVAGSGPAPAIIAATAVVACLAFLGLSRLLSPREEFS